MINVGLRDFLERNEDFFQKFRLLLCNYMDIILMRIWEKKNLKL